MSSSSSSGIAKKLAVTIIMSVLYGAISVSLDPRYASFITDQDFGDIRPAIFFPAIIAILYGPLVGGLTAGIGNLIYDTTTTIYFSGEQLDISNLVGFIGNFVGAAVVGIFSKPYRYDNDPFSYREATEGDFGTYFNIIFFRRIVRNTMAAVIGLSLVTGLIIGYGQRLDPTFTTSISFIIFTSIAYWNGLFLIVAIPIIYSMLSVMDYIQAKNARKELEMRRSLDVKVDKEYPFDFVRVGSPKGDELWNLEWGAMNLVLKNTDTVAHNYSIRVKSNDIFSPHRHTTAILEPNAEDELYFNIYGITSGTKDSSIFVKVDDNQNEYEIPFNYEMGSSNELIFKKLMGILLFIAFGVSISLIILNIRDNFILDQATIFALAALPVEIIGVLTLYIIWNNRRTKHLFESMGLRKGESDVKPQLVENVMNEDDTSILQSITKRRRVSAIFLLLGVPIFILLGYIIISNEQGESNLGIVGDILQMINLISTGELVFILISILIVVLSISDFYLEKSENLEKQILDQREQSSKIIRKAVTAGTPEIYQTTEIYLKVFNPFNTSGMRIFFHSIDNITPQELEIEDIPSQGTKVVTINFTSLQDGKRKVGMEVVQFRNEKGEVIPQEKANTFDQEVIELNVSNTRVLGLSPGQISMLRGTVAGIGSLTFAVTFLANLLGLTINQQFLQTTLPLLIILQVPVLWLSLYLQDKIKNSLNYED